MESLGKRGTEPSAESRVWWDRAIVRRSVAKVLEGWNVEESEIVKEWIAIGEKRGEARAVARGHVKGRVESFFEILSAKFGAVPEDVATTAPDVATFRQQAGI